MSQKSSIVFIATASNEYISDNDATPLKTTKFRKPFSILYRLSLMAMQAF